MAATRARQDFVGFAIGDREREMDMRILVGSHWAIISQKHATSLPHIDTAGAYTVVNILAGVKFWAIKETTLNGSGEKDVDDTEYFVDLTKRDFHTLPGGRWVPLLLFPGDML